MTSFATSRLAHVELSPTYALLDKVHQLRRSGVDVLDLGGGEPDFDTPDHIKQAAHEALAAGQTHYTPSRGDACLLQALADKLRRDNSIDVDPQQGLIVTPSAKHALFISLLAALRPGDEVIIPTPCWPSYLAMTQIAGGVPVALPLQGTDGWRLTQAALETKRSVRTRAVLINTPTNPTGRVLTLDELEAVAEFAQRNDLLIIADEIYEKLVYCAARHISVASLPAAAQRTLTVNGFSKSYAMTGWRLGYVAGPPSLVGDLLKLQQHSVGCAGSFVQAGGRAALLGDQEPIAEMSRTYLSRMRLIVEGLNSVPGFSCRAVEGSFYAFASVAGTGFPTSAELAAWLLDEAHVALTPGSAFGPGGEGHVRLSFATSAETINKAIDRMCKALRHRQSQPQLAGASA